MSNALYNIPQGFSTAITPNDNKDNVPDGHTGIWLEAGGTLSVLFKDGSSHVYGYRPKHTELWGDFKRILSTGTTVAAGNIYMMRADRYR
jgi:hypothetical protein